MENKEMHIDCYIKKILNDKYFFQKEYKKFIENDYNIENVFGSIDANLLKAVIIKAKRNTKIRVLLADILFYIDHESITYDNFQLLLNFPGKYKLTYLSNIGHSELSFYQMKILNAYPLSLEVFSWLFDKICKYDFFTTGDMLDILNENKSIKNVAISECIKHAESKYGPSDKTNIAKYWLSRNGKTGDCSKSLKK